MYHIKLLLKYTIREQIFYEESILQIDADSFDAAYQKAEVYASQIMDTQRKNMYGNTVHCSIVDYLDCFQSDNIEDDVQEVYSRIFQNRFGLSEKELEKCLGDSSTREEMLPLRYFPDQNEI
ncbi:DUF4288 domain-containing protein [uncultured Ruminococcus sp.]|uniref:DUF4288 domain-containing protein n=1 Tax=uncultured Ruminococcus sp. TaxID=165186 RepID=UPI0026373126|nr:DUF4288 domain-containing protein [uncultured Ruminococcus sp.]